MQRAKAGRKRDRTAAGMLFFGWLAGMQADKAGVFLD